MCARKTSLRLEPEVDALRVKIQRLKGNAPVIRDVAPPCLFGIAGESDKPFGALLVRIFRPGAADEPASELTIGLPGAQEIQDPADRDIIARLYGARHEDDDGSAPAKPAVRLWGKVAADLLPKLVATGRAFAMDNARRRLYTENPIDMETQAPPWQFAVVAGKPGGAGDFRLRGVMMRGKKIRELDSFSVFTEDGWLLDNDRLDRFDLNRGAIWFTLLRKQPFINLKTRHMTDFLEEVCEGAPLPPVIWPKDVRPPILQDCHPVPVLHLAAGLSGAYTGELHFDYGSAKIPEAELRTYVKHGMHYIERDPAAESMHCRQLAEAGAVALHDTTSRVTGRWHIAAAIVGDSILALMALGWRIDCADAIGPSMPVIAGQKWHFFVGSGIDWFDLKGIEWNDVASTSRTGISAILQALAEHKSFVRIPGQGWAVINNDMKRLVASIAAIGDRQGPDAFRITPEQAALIGSFGSGSIPAVGDGGEAISLEEFKQHLRRDSKALEIVPENPPASFVGELRDYQKYGLGWLHFLQRYRLGGCLADDMGLGKTVQVIAMFEKRRLARMSRKDLPPSLVVVMASLLGNWHDELARFAPKLRVLCHYGPNRDISHGHFAAHDVILTTYGTLVRDIGWMRLVEFDYVVLDEAQQIKNEDSHTAHAARNLKAHNRLALTGTPVMNRARELKSLFDFLSPGLFSQLPALGDAALNPKHNPDEARLMGNILRPFILRRKKGDVLKELPARMNQVIFCDLGEQERAEYDEFRNELRLSLLPRIEAVGVNRMRMHILEALLRLRQLACHPGLIDPERRSDTSTKLDELDRQLEEVLDEGHKVLVFSQFVSFLKIVRTRLDTRDLRDSYLYLDGQTPAVERTRLVKEFQKDETKRLFLISLKAGGLGLNLTAADYVYILDPWWNPSIEDQAIDRAHRIGQTRSVFAYRLISRNTVEEKVLLLQEKKRELVDAILTGENASLEGITKNELLMLLS